MAYQNHSFPTKNVKFTTDLWTEFTTLIGTNINLMTTFQPQQGEQTHFMGQAIKYLRSFLTPYNSVWYKYLLIAEFTLNTQESPLGHTPYSLLYNQHAHIPDTIVTPLTDNDLPGDVTAYVGRWQTNMNAARTLLTDNPMQTLKKKYRWIKGLKLYYKPFKLFVLSFIAVTENCCSYKVVNPSVPGSIADL
jgi:hypothetical protein